MTGNSKEIKKLKYQQAKLKEIIRRYKERKKKHLFFLIIPFIGYILIQMDTAYKIYGSNTNFYAITLSTLGLLTVIYLGSVRYLIRKRQREIKIIRSKLYKLMKLEDG